MRRSVTAVIAATAVLSMVILCSCRAKVPDEGSAQPQKETITVYDLSSDLSHVEPSEYHLDADKKDLSKCTGELLQRIIDGPEGARSRSAIPGEITSVTYIIGAETVVVNFDSAFNELSVMQKVLCEASVVRTLCQLEDVYAVSFSAGGSPVCDSGGIPLGLLTPDSFVENDGAMINAFERAELHLFFADSEGTGLVEKVETLTYNSNIPMDRLVVDNIVSGPQSTDAFATVNPETTVNSVTTQDGTCYVNLSDDFLIRTSNVSDEVMVYSIVNSLTYLGNINKVQILVDGKADEMLGEIDLSNVFERNLEL